MSYVLSCCSTADMTEEYFKQRDIHYICFHFELDGQQYADDLGKSISFEAFYQAMEDGAETKTSQVNVDEFINYFTPFLKQGKDILHVTLSSGISGVYNSAMIAKSTLEEQFPNRKIYIVDSLAASSGFGLLMDGAADERDKGKSIEEVRDWLEENKLKLNHWFFSTDLTFYVKGGRVSKTAGLFGTLLNICPMLNVNDTGHLIPREKIRTKRKAITRIEELMQQHARDGLNYNGKCFMSNSACYEDARAVADLIEKHFPNIDGKVVINTIGTTIGSHTGPGTVALFFWGDTRTE
ncbi:MAG: DegV family protein [Clostridia bacterium]|nr:DegV family protein [Clostridia bacterium]